MSCSKVWRENFQSQWPNWSTKAKRQIMLFKWDSSAFSAGQDDSQILFFDPFLFTHVVLDTNNRIQVTPTNWASAFLEFNIGNCAKVLCTEVFTFEELSARRNANNDITVLPFAKMNSIKKAALWMMNKNQNPWDYTPFAYDIILSPDQETSVNSAFQTFETVCAPIYTPEEEPFREKANVRNNEMNYFRYEYQRILEEIRHGKLTPIGNTAQTVENLTIIALGEKNQDVFVDAVQFSKKRWTKALQADGICGTADVLFRKYLLLDITLKNKKFTCYRDFCPVKRLAIIRAVAFLKSPMCIFSEAKFDSSLPSHNLFLTEEQVDEINAHIDNLYGPKTSFTEMLNMDMDESSVVGFDDLLQITNGPQTPSTPSSSNTFTPYSSSNNSPAQGSVPSNMIENFQVFSIENVPMSVSDLKAQVLASISKDSKGRYVFGEESFTEAQWEEALKIAKDGEVIKAGKYLFRLLFTDEDLKCSKSGRVGKDGQKPEKISESKQIAIREALRYVQALVTDGQLKEWSKLERDSIDDKIFISYRNSLMVSKKRKATSNRNE